MAGVQASREQHLDLIVENLSAELGGTVPLNRVAAEVNRAYTELSETSRVPAFISILALRRARAALMTEQPDTTE